MDRSELTAAAADGAVRAALAVIVGLAVTVAIGLVLWAITPGTDIGAETAVRAAAAAYSLAHFGSIGIGGAALTMAPLLLTLIFAAVLAVGAGRGRAGGTAAAQGAWTVAGSLTYAALVVVSAVTLAPPGTAVLRAGTGALFLAAVALGLTVLRRGAALRDRLLDLLPGWATTGLLAGAAALFALIGGAALVLAIALGLRLPTAADLTSTLTGGGGDAVGLALAGLAYLPNAVLAAVGYVTGVGFQVGDGRWSPLGSVPGDLPPFPLLAAVPGAAGVSAPGLVAMLVPVVAAVVAALVVLRGTAARRRRWAALGTAAGVAGVLAGVLVWAGSGGVSGGAWPHIGATGWQVALAAAATVMLVGGAWIAAAGRGAASVADGPTADRPSVDTGAGKDPDAAVDRNTVDRKTVGRSTVDRNTVGRNTVSGADTDRADTGADTAVVMPAGPDVRPDSAVARSVDPAPAATGQSATEQAATERTSAEEAPAAETAAASPLDESGSDEPDTGHPDTDRPDIDHPDADPGTDGRTGNRENPAH